MEEPETYAYAAFVSYRHREDDRRWAQWLVEALESYHTPERVVRDGYAARLGRIFRDDDELKAMPDLTPAIRQALFESRYLLVVCSEETPRSHWVRAEIALFQHWGRGDRIIPILIEGGPASSFPPELTRTEVIGHGAEATFRTVEPRGPDVTPKQGMTEAEQRELALLTIAATLLGCPFAKLKDRHEERERKLTSHAWFDQIVWRRGAPEGLVDLREETVRRRNASYRVETMAGRVVRVRRENSRGLLSEEKGVAQWDVSYREDGSVELVEERSRHGSVRLRRRYSRDARTVDLAQEDESAAPMAGLATGFGFGDALGKEFDGRKSTIVRHLVDYDEAGFPVRRRYCRDAFNTPAGDMLGHYGDGAENDASGRALRQWVLDSAGERMIQRNGIAETRLAYAPQGWLAGWTYLDEGGQPICGNNGVASCEQCHDAFGNLTGWIVRDEAGLPTMSKDGKCQVLNRIDEQGDWTFQELLGPQGEPMPCKQGWARVCNFRDKRGNIVREDYLGAGGEPVVISEGYSSRAMHYDSRDNPVRSDLLGSDGKPTCNKDGVSSSISEYDAQGNEISYAQLGLDGQPVLDKRGFACVIKEFDERGLLAKLAAFGTSGQPCLLREGIAGFTFRYDARGNKIKEAYFGMAGEPALHRDGYARLVNEYDPGGNMIDQAYFGVDGAPVLIRAGYARMTVNYDTRGQIAELTFFGVSGEPVLTRNRYARETRRYDARGNLVEQSFFGIDGQPVNTADGYARATARHDARGNVIETAWFDPQGEPIFLKNYRYVRSTNAYDTFGNRIETRMFGKNGEPVLCVDHYATIRWKYDDRGQMIDMAAFGLDDEPVVHRIGTARIAVQYDNRGNTIEEACFGVDGNPGLCNDHFSIRRARYDQTDHEVEESVYGIDGKPCLHRRGFASVRKSYDDRGNVIEQCYFGLANEPVDTIEGYAAFAAEYDERGNCIAKRYRGADGKPALRTNSSCEDEEDLKGIFGIWRALMLGALYSPEDMERIARGGFAAFEQRFDPRGNVIARWFTGADGEPVEGPEGLARIEVEHDPLDQPLVIRGFRPDGSPLPELRIDYTPCWDVDRLRFTTADGAPWLNRQGYATMDLVHDACYTHIETRYLDEAGNLVHAQPADAG